MISCTVVLVGIVWPHDTVGGGALLEEDAESPLHGSSQALKLVALQGNDGSDGGDSGGSRGSGSLGS